MGKRIAVVGAGVGGLSTAARLARNGYAVEVFEKLPRCGGRNHLLEDRGFKFDMGPSFVMMPDFFEEVFSYCGRNLTDYLDLKIVDPSYKIFFSDGDILTVYKDSHKTQQELEKIEKDSSTGFEGFITETTRIYNAVRPLLYECFTPKAISNPRYWSLLTKIRALDSYWKLASRFFKSEKLRYAFTFEAMFMGVSPYDAPAFYSVISYADHVQKIFHPMGGMYQIPLALEKMGREFGAKYNYNSEVGMIKSKGSKVALEIKGSEIDTFGGVPISPFRVEKEYAALSINPEQTQSFSPECGEWIDFDKVVVNADYAYALSQLLGRKIPNYKYSCSVYLIYLGLKRKVEGLSHHNLFFSADLGKNLDQIFKGKAIPKDPSFYVHVPTVTDESLAPPGKDIFYILVPVPNLQNNKIDFMDSEGKLRKTVFDKINSLLGINLEDLIEVEHRFYPQDFISRYNIKFGATFGLAHNLTQSAFFRPPNFDNKIKNLYFVGASTQPGGGLPVVIAGSRIVADLITQGKH